MCKKLFRSGLGLLLHIENCGSLVEHLKCEYCQRLYTKLSLNIHVRTCPERIQNLVKPTNSIPEEAAAAVAAGEIAPEMLSNTGRQKRVSTLKAEKAIIAHLDDIRIEDDKAGKPFDPKTVSGLPLF